MKILEFVASQIAPKSSSVRLVQRKPSSSSKSLIYRTAPHMALEILERYFRLEVEGAENIPQGGALLLPNHSGYLGLDALLLNHWIFKNRKRIPRILLHRPWFTQSILQSHAERFGFLEASYDNGVFALNKKIL